MLPPLREIETTRVYEKLHDCRARYAVLVGGARSSKSYSIAQRLIERFATEQHKTFLVTRKTFPALRLTAYKLIVDMLEDIGIYPDCEHNKSDHTIKLGSNFMQFMSIDNPEKIKSTEWNYIWPEEATEFTWEDWIVLRTRMSGPCAPGEFNQAILSLNPTDEFCWIHQRLLLDEKAVKDGTVQLIHSTYKDNPFLDLEYRKSLEELQEQDPHYWKIFGLGEWGTLRNIIYNPYQLANVWPERFYDEIYGLDFGYNVPTSLLHCGLLENKWYLREKLYETNLTNQDLIERLKVLFPRPEDRHANFYADCAEPGRIEEIRRAGFNVYPADKEVKDGLDYCKRQQFVSCAANVNLNKERSAYKYKEDKNGNVLDEPVKFNDHLMDAKRYAIWTHHKLYGQKPAMAVTGQNGAAPTTPDWL